MSDSGGIEKRIEPIYDAAVAPERWPRFLERLSSELGAPALYLVLRFPGEDDPGALFTVGTDPSYDQAYREHYWRKDPWRPLAHLLPEGEVASGHRLLPEEELVRTEFYNDWMRPQGHYHPFTALLRQRGGIPLASLSGFQPKSAEPLDARQLERLKVLVPHLQRALAIHQRLRETEMRRIGLSEALDRVAGAVIVLDQDGRPLEVNRAAEELLARSDGFHLDRDGPRAATKRETAELRRRVAEAVQTRAQRGGPGGERLSLGRPSGRPPLQAVVAPMGREASPVFDRRAEAAIFLSDPELHPRPRPERLRCLHELTPTEAELASQLAGGRRLKDIAKELGVSIHTARAHLKHVFAKTGTRRQADLVRVLLSGLALRVD